MKYAPSFSLTAGSLDLSKDLLHFKLEGMISHAASPFTMEIDNRFDKYASLAWLDPVHLEIDGTPILQGRIDTILDAKSKPPIGKGKTLTIEGRDGFGALCDVRASKYVRARPTDNVVDEIVALYNSLKLSQDPVLFVESNRASHSVLMSNQWTNKSCQAMLLDVGTILGAPVVFGGANTFFDFFVRPNLGFVFEEAGHRSSGIDLGSTVQYDTLQKKIDSLPVKTDYWITGDDVSGCIPLQMQLGYGTQAVDERLDPWTETNPTDYFKGTNCSAVDIRGPSDGPQFGVKIGSWMIVGFLQIPVNVGDPDYGYFYIRFPSTNLNGIYWPSQAPSGGLNTMNMTRLDETMGEISDIGFFIRCLDASDIPQFRLELVDGTTPNTIASKKVLLTTAWAYYQHSIGLQSKIVIKTDETKLTDDEWNLIDINGVVPDPDEDKATFDWLNIAEIRFVGFLAGGTVSLPRLPSICLDGFRFVKPLIAHAQSTATTTTYRPEFESASEITSYKAAKIYAAAMCQNIDKPQQYYLIKNIGRVDLPHGYSFTFDSKTLVARRIVYEMDKSRGWRIDVEGWEAT